MSAHQVQDELYRALTNESKDPGDAGTIYCDRAPQAVPLVSGASGETRTLAVPDKPGLVLSLCLKTDGGGDITLTVTSGYDQAASTTVTFGDAGDYITFVSIAVGANYRWRVLGYDGVTGPTTEIAILDLDTLTVDTGIVPDTSGGAYLGTTTLEWGNVYLADNVGIYFGADQDASIVHDNGTGVDFSIADNDAAALDIKQGSNSYLKFVTTNSGEKVAIGKTLFGADLTLDSTNEINIQIGGVGALAIDDAAIASHAAAADTVGKAVYIETQDGGVDTAVDGGSAGGLLSLKTGDGSAGGAAQAGGAGGALTLTTGAGAAPASGSANGGAGGTFTIAGGAGGAAGAAGGTGGAGGSIALTPGAGGGAGGGTAGATGFVNVTDGHVLFVGVAAVPGTTRGGNWIGIEDSGTDPSGTLTNALALYTPDAGDSLDFLHADGTTDSLGT